MPKMAVLLHEPMSFRGTKKWDETIFQQESGLEHFCIFQWRKSFQECYIKEITKNYQGHPLSLMDLNDNRLSRR